MSGFESLGSGCGAPVVSRVGSRVGLGLEVGDGPGESIERGCRGAALAEHVAVAGDAGLDLGKQLLDRERAGGLGVGVLAPCGQRGDARLPLPEVDVGDAGGLGAELGELAVNELLQLCRVGERAAPKSAMAKPAAANSSEMTCNGRSACSGGGPGCS